MALVFSGNRPYKFAPDITPDVASHVLRNHIVSIQCKCGQDMGGGLKRMFILVYDGRRGGVGTDLRVDSQDRRVWVAVIITYLVIAWILSHSSACVKQKKVRIVILVILLAYFLLPV